MLSTILYLYLLGPIIDHFSTVQYNNDHVDFLGLILLIFIFSIAACVQNAATLKKLNNEGWLYRIIIFFLDILVMPLSLLAVVLYNNYHAIGMINISSVFNPLVFILVHSVLQVLFLLILKRKSDRNLI
ncbi:hypothetical protein GFS24_05330 [Chitinophaga sp. SYP-B3965]|uniref:hypothetical protein n=1 Tax=Chitinophaga sp. SYP-B3965 TaxID=2663120 RepID=UPI0012999A23|nr:hypothetical protein [Chitinophaga sp. SYP-B3965]MRG44523.1 hypothetical protein [Chitinophaga sp. SYP-B3965]